MMHAIDAAAPYVWVFMAAFALDFIWAVYMEHVNSKSAARAAGWAAALFVVSAFTTVSYVENHWLLAPAVLGAAAGTYAAVRGLASPTAAILDGYWDEAVAAFGGSAPPRGTCNLPPEGWWCSGDAGHDGPCTAWPASVPPGSANGSGPGNDGVARPPTDCKSV